MGQLQKRQKWSKEKPNVEVGRVVLLKDKDTHPCDWPMGVVVKVYPDAEGRVRVAEVRTTKNQACFKRSVAKLVLLPINVNAEP